EATQKRMLELNQEMTKLQTDMDGKVSPALKVERDNLHVEEQSLRNEMAALWMNEDIEPYFEILGELFNGMPSARMRGALPAMPGARAGEDARITALRGKVVALRQKITDLNQREKAE